MVEQVIRLNAALESIPGLREVSVQKMDVGDLTADDFSLLPYADLPLGAMKRTAGGRADELVICMDFALEEGVRGLLGLEFVSWWVRDAARAGAAMQVRSLALPPIGEQFGSTLRFRIDWFYTDPDNDMQRLLAAVDALASDLESTIAQQDIVKRIEGRNGPAAVVPGDRPGRPAPPQRVSAGLRTLFRRKPH